MGMVLQDVRQIRMTTTKPFVHIIKRLTHLFFRQYQHTLQHPSCSGLFRSEILLPWNKEARNAARWISIQTMIGASKQKFVSI
jgi:hypothetical protein